MTDELIEEDYIYWIYSIIVLVFCFIFCIANCYRYILKNGLSNHIVSSSIQKEVSLSNKILFILTGLLSMGGVFVFVLGTGMSITELLIASRFEWFATGTYSPFVLNLGLYLISLIAIYSYFDMTYRIPLKCLSIIVYSSIAFMMFIAGGRKWVLFIASGWLAAYYDMSNRKIVIKKRLLIFAIIILFFVFSWQYYRAITWQNGLSMGIIGQNFFGKCPELFLKGDITYFYRASLEAIKLHIQDGLTFPLALLRRLILLPIPASWTMGLKPEDIAAMFSDAIGAGDVIRRGNMPPGLIGLFVLSFGWVISVISFGPVMVYLMRIIDVISHGSHGVVRDVIIANFFVISILLMRGSESSIYFLVFDILVVILCRFISLIAKSFVKPTYTYEKL